MRFKKFLLEVRKTTTEPHKKPGWNRTMARRSLGKMLSTDQTNKCSTCVGIGFILNKEKGAMPPIIDCPDCGTTGKKNK